MKKTIRFRNLSGGLRLAGDAGDGAPRNVMRRNRGIHPVSEGIFETRDGSTQLHAVNAVHSLTYYDDTWYAGASTLFYEATTQIKSGLSGDRLSFTRMSPTAGKKDWLFVAGGDDLFKVSGTPQDDGTELVTNGTMEADANWANTTSAPATNERSTTQFMEGAYSRKFTPDAANEGIKGDTFTTVAKAHYHVTAWVYPDDGTTVTVRVYSGGAGAWIYNTSHTGLTENDWNEIDFVYTESTAGAAAFIQFDSGASTSGDWYIDNVSIQRTYYATDWGIPVPDDTLTAADGGDGGALDDGAVYKYRATFYNSITGSRGDATPAGDTYTKLLLHCDGADGHTTFTDSSSSAHANATCVNSAQGDTGVSPVFGTASLMCELDTSDYITIPDSVDWAWGDDPFTVDFRVRFESLAAKAGLFGQWQATGYLTYLYWGTNDQLYFFSVVNHGIMLR
jgi:hypothetical protein